MTHAARDRLHVGGAAITHSDVQLTTASAPGRTEI